MGKTKHPDEVEEKNFSDSLELFDTLFQEELEDGTDKQVSSKGPTPAVQTTTPKTTPNKQPKKIPKTEQKQQRHRPTDKPAVKRKTAPPKTPDGQESVDMGIDSRAERPAAEGMPAQDKKSISASKEDTLEMARKRGQPKLEPEDVEQETEIEREFVPHGIILKGINRINRPLSSPAKSSVDPDKIGKLYTPKESKSLLSGVSIKESNLYKVVLAGFAFAIVVMVLINFFGIMNADDTEKTSRPVNKNLADGASSKKLPDKSKRVNKPKASLQKKNPSKTRTDNRVAQKKSPRPSSTSKGNPITTKSNIKQGPGTQSGPDSKPQPRTILPIRNRAQPDNQIQTTAPKSAQQPNTMIQPPAPQKPSSRETPDSPFSSTEASRTAEDMTAKETTIDKKSLEPVVAMRPEPVPPPTPTPSPTATQKSADGRPTAPKIVERAFPYSIYLGAYKTLERAKVAVSLHKEEGLSTYWVKVDLGSKGTWFRIFTGYFQNEDDAQDFIDQRALEEASVKRTRYSTLIGVYSSKDAIERESEALLKLGYSVYAIEGVNGTSQLYTGAFYTRAGAEKLYEELAAKGIPNQVVER